MSKNHREPLLDAAQRLILARGFTATRVDDVCKEAGVTKGSFYHHFSSKEELAAQLVERYFEDLAAVLLPGSPGQQEPVDRLLTFLGDVVKITKGPLLRDGCVLGSLAVELRETCPELHGAVAERFERLLAVVEPLYRAALRRAAPAPGISAPVLARQFLAVLQGGIVVAKAASAPQRLSEAMGCHRALVQSLLSA